MPYRFVHTADLHLDSPLRSLAMRDEELAGTVATASREAFSAIVQRCLDERVDALMIAGDLFDSAQNSVKTALFLCSELKLLSDAGIETFIVRGNHDARTAFGRGVDLPEGVHVFDGHGRAQASGSNERVHVHGVSFRDAHAPESLLPKYARPDADGVHIGLMHTSLAGAEGHDPYAPCSLADLTDHGFHYWGLGHVHGRTVHHDSGRAAVVMPGMPQGRDVGEAGEKSATLVAIEDDGTVTLDQFPTALAEFARVEVHLDPTMGWRDALAAAEKALIEASARTSACRLVARLRITGETPHAWHLTRDAHEFAEQVTEELRRDDPNAQSGIYVEKVEMRVAPPGNVARGSAIAPGATAELGAIMREVANEAEFRELALARAERIMKSFPPRSGDIRDAAFGRNEGEYDARLTDMIERGLELMSARLEGAEHERVELGGAERGA